MDTNNSVNSTDPCNDSTTYVETQISHWLWKLVGPIIFITGVTGNLLVLWVLKRLRFTSSSTLVHLFVLAMTDTSVLCAGLTRYWANFTFQFDIRHTTDFGCKFHLYFTYTTMDFSAWILVSVTAERVVCVYFPLHVRSWCTVRRAFWRLLATYILLSVINCHYFWAFGLVEEDGVKYCQLVDRKMLFYDRYVFAWVDLCFVSLIPFAIMLICNVFIIRALKRGELFNTQWHHSRTTRGPNTNIAHNKNTATTRLLLVVTTFFGCSTIPASLVYIVESFVRRDCDWKTHAQMELAWTLTYLLQFSNYAVNFILYTTRNHKFRNEVLLLFHLRKARLHTTSTRTLSSSTSLQNNYDNPDVSSRDRKPRHLVLYKEPLDDPSSDDARDVKHVTSNVNTSQSERARSNALTHAISSDTTRVSLTTVGRLHNHSVETDTSFCCDNDNTCEKNCIKPRLASHSSRNNQSVKASGITSPDCHINCHLDQRKELPSSANSSNVFATKESASHCEIDNNHKQLISGIFMRNYGQKYTDGLEKEDGDVFNTYL